MQKDDFSVGFATACAVMVRNHGQDTCVEDAYMCNFKTVRQLRDIGVDEYDIEILKPIIKEIERKLRL